jgi:hypothetical protein
MGGQISQGIQCVFHIDAGHKIGVSVVFDERRDGTFGNGINRMIVPVVLHPAKSNKQAAGLYAPRVG